MGQVQSQARSLGGYDRPPSHKREINSASELRTCTAFKCCCTPMAWRRLSLIAESTQIYPWTFTLTARTPLVDTCFGNQMKLTGGAAENLEFNPQLTCSWLKTRTGPKCQRKANRKVLFCLWGPFTIRLHIRLAKVRQTAARETLENQGIEVMTSASVSQVDAEQVHIQKAWLRRGMAFSI